MKKPTKTTVRKSSTRKNKSQAWFYSIRGSYLPKSWQGWLTYVPYVAVLVGSTIWAQTNAVSVADYFYRVFPVWVAAAVAMNYLAKQKS